MNAMIFSSTAAESGGGVGAFFVGDKKAHRTFPKKSLMSDQGSDNKKKNYPKNSNYYPFILFSAPFFIF